jgi:tungstate transport system substrate-binding protein
MHHPVRAPRWRHVMALALAAILVLGLAGCQPEEPTSDVDTGRQDVEVTKVILASTTSTEDSGLFGVLIPAFEDEYPEYDIDVVAVGTGEALEIGRKKDADVLLVHAKADEETFVEEGYGVERRDVMYNDFVIVGPPSDPAGLKGTNDAAAALQKIAGDKISFASRGDDSGTHKKELKLWEAAGISASGDWYDSIGQGMGDTLNFASEKQSYTLADRGTFLSMRDKVDLEIIVEGDEALFNPYGVIVVAEASNPEGAQAFADWIVSAEGQAIIEEFGVDTYGEPLFVPNAQ